MRKKTPPTTTIIDVCDNSALSISDALLILRKNCIARIKNDVEEKKQRAKTAREELIRANIHHNRARILQRRLDVKIKEVSIVTSQQSGGGDASDKYSIIFSLPRWSREIDENTYIFPEMDVHVVVVDGHNNRRTQCWIEYTPTDAKKLTVISASGTINPFFDGSNFFTNATVCLGDNRDTVWQNITEGRISDAITLITNIITSGDATSGYRTWYVVAHNVRWLARAVVSGHATACRELAEFLTKNRAYRDGWGDDYVYFSTIKAYIRTGPYYDTWDTALSSVTLYTYTDVADYNTYNHKYILKDEDIVDGRLTLSNILFHGVATESKKRKKLNKKLEKLLKKLYETKERENELRMYEEEERTTDTPATGMTYDIPALIDKLIDKI